MKNPVELEEIFEEYMSDLQSFLPDGVMEVDLALLQELELLECADDPHLEEETHLTQSFFVIESSEKLTLYNESFVIWIVPLLVDHTPTTYSLIALDKPEGMHLEMVFATTGVYNHSGLVLRILEKFLDQIEENEKELCKYRKVSD